MISISCGVNMTRDGDADMREEVTDAGLHALASAGCGVRLTSLSLSRE